MTDHDALLRAVCENPRDDLPRLVYADWLEDHGQPDRAAFIRTEVDVYRRPEWDAERVRYEAAARNDPSPLSRTPEAVASPAGMPAGVMWAGSPAVRRGFPWCLRVLDPYDLFSRRGERVGRLPVERLMLTRNPVDFARLLDQPWLPRVSGLEFRTGAYGARPLALLGHAVAAGGVEELALASAASPAGAAALPDTPLFARLTSLTLTSISPRATEALLDGITRAGGGLRLRHLHLGKAQLRADGLDRLADAVGTARLDRLELTNNPITGDRARAVAGMPLASVRVLNLSGNPIGNAGAVALAESPNLPNLLVLDLSYCQVGDDGIRAILDSPLADRLVMLDLTGSPASAEAKLELKARMGDRVRV